MRDGKSARVNYDPLISFLKLIINFDRFKKQDLM